MGINQRLAVDELPHLINIEGYHIDTDFFYNIVIYLGIRTIFLKILVIQTPARQEMIQFLLVEV